MCSNIRLIALPPALYACEVPAIIVGDLALPTLYALAIIVGDISLPALYAHDTRALIVWT